ncbi:glycosyltransferase family 2 protein [Mucilaginibacter pallidiroseus]|uniref:Glycosyltransferase family 2 protein n=1 Tax=Mucilaginibacter pallidiroseus TaxID=2599295 RepID=A0A563UBZ7_9SPHI|nr:glycosyltransferase family A protein [Mucilaginibacter pallidiroseus]TWR28850.1 glycosyltransferase family 2 protein [Mucilaginibacter pallidiroseus]
MNMPMVSIIIPCYNCAAFIDRAITSVLKQDIKDIELILVDNNSTDQTFAVMRDYQAKHPDLIRIYQELKKGAPAARNYGLKYAKGEWIQFLDADDELLPEKIQQQLNLALAANADVVAGDCLLKYDNGKTEITRYTDQNIWRGLINSKLGITSSNLWRATALRAVNGWDEALTSSQEYDLLFRLIKNKAVVITDKSINTIVHFSNNSVSKSTDLTKLKQILNNRVNLRLQIKNELRYRSQLTPALKSTIDLYIYTEIMSFQYLFPEYVNSLLQVHQPKVALYHKVKIKARQYVKQLK